MPGIVRSVHPILCAAHKMASELAIASGVTQVRVRVIEWCAVDHHGGSSRSGDRQ